MMIMMMMMIVGAWQGCPLYPVLFNTFLEKIMHKTLITLWQSEDGQCAASSEEDADEYKWPVSSPDI